MRDLDSINSVEDLDEYLLDELGAETPETEVVEGSDNEPEVVETVVENTATDPIPDVVEQVTPSNEDNAKSNNAFAQLRIEANEARKQAQENAENYRRSQELIANIAKSSGFKTPEEFQLAFKEQYETKEMTDLGMSPAEYQGLKDMRESANSLEQREHALAKREIELQTVSFGNAILDFSRENGINIEKIYEKLDSTGISPTQFATTGQDFNAFMKGAMIDDIIEARVNAFKATPERVVDTAVLDTSGNTDSEIDIDALIEAELKEYAQGL